MKIIAAINGEQIKKFLKLFPEAALEWQEDRSIQLGAALAFFAILSLPPLLVTIIAVTGWVFGEEAAQGQIVDQIQFQIGSEGAQAIQTMIKHAARPEGTLGAAIIGILTLIFSATGAFAQLQDALNTIWQVKPKSKKTIFKNLLAFFLKRAFSFLMVLGIGVLLFLTFLLDMGLAIFSKFLIQMEFFPTIFHSGLIKLLGFSLSFALGTLLIAMIYKVIPDVRITWRDVWFGALATSIMFTAGKFLIGLYLAKISVGSAYGAAGSFMILLFWIFLGTQILFFGAELTEVYSKHYGSGIIPSDNAVRIKTIVEEVET